MAGDEAGLLCARCLKELTPGEVDFYLVKIEAVADPSPPVVSAEDLQRDAAGEIERLLEEMRDLSERELLEQVYRRLTLTLCGACFREWIEHPTGSETPR